MLCFTVFKPTTLFTKTSCIKMSAGAIFQIFLLNSDKKIWFAEIPNCVSKVDEEEFCFDLCGIMLRPGPFRYAMRRVSDFAAVSALVTPNITEMVLPT